jgi:hypothetical protein
MTMASLGNVASAVQPLIPSNLMIHELRSPGTRQGQVVGAGSARVAAATGEAAEGDVSALEQFANNLSGSPALFLKGPVPWP